MCIFFLFVGLVYQLLGIDWDPCLLSFVSASLVTHGLRIRYRDFIITLNMILLALFNLQEEMIQLWITLFLIEVRFGILILLN